METITSNLYDESIRMLWASQLVYSFAALLKEGRDGKLDLGDSFPAEVLDNYKKNRLDVRGLEDEHGLSFNKVVQIVKANVENLKKIMDSDWEYIAQIIEKLQSAEDADKSSNSLFLETFNSINAVEECVYGVVKDTNNKRVTVVFRGSTSGTRDWETNFSAQMEAMKTPKLLRDKLEDSLKERILVHRGFYEYLFNNEKAKGDQAFDTILGDIKPFVKDGYKIYTTGHSLGAALSSLLAFKLAGSGKKWIPKPITCISYASPFVGSDGFRTAFTELEKMGLIRYLRVNNDSDFVPTIPPVSIGWPIEFMKHVGINLRLEGNSFALSHPNTNGYGVVNALNNSMFKPVWKVLHYHGIPTHQKRMDKHKEALQQMSIENLYADKNLFG